MTLQCLFCGGSDILRERSPSGSTFCKSCGYKNKSITWDELSSEQTVVPIGCSNRMQFILDQADILSALWRNGNKEAVFIELTRRLPVHVALAVLATMVDQDSHIAEYMREKA